MAAYAASWSRELVEGLLRPLGGVVLRDFLVALFLGAEEDPQRDLGRGAALDERHGRRNGVRIVLAASVEPNDALRRHDLLPHEVVRIGAAIGALDRGVPHSARLDVERVRGDLAARRATPLGELGGAGECVEDESPGALDDARDDDLPVRLAATTRADALYSLKSMDGIAPSLGVGAVRINSDIVTWPERAGNVRREKVPAAPGGRWVGLVLLFSSETGEPLAILPDGYLQRLRVGATNGLGARYLAREDARTVGLLGSGWQASGQLMAIAAVRLITKVRCYSTSAAGREAFAARMSHELGVEVEPVESADAAVRGADVVLCATNSIEHVLFQRQVEPGMHLSSIKRPEIECRGDPRRRSRRRAHPRRAAAAFHRRRPPPARDRRGKGLEPRFGR